MEKYTDYRFEEPDHGKERECLPFSSLAITDHTKFQLKRCSFCARETAYGTKQFSYPALGKKFVTTGLHGH